jgi:hypothetical protein
MPRRSAAWQRLRRKTAALAWPTFAELFPARIRATGQGFTVSAGRGFASIIPATVKVLAITPPLNKAMGFCGLSGYVIALTAVYLVERNQRD